MYGVRTQFWAAIDSLERSQAVDSRNCSRTPRSQPGIVSPCFLSSCSLAKAAIISRSNPWTASSANWSGFLSCDRIRFARVGNARDCTAGAFARATPCSVRAQESDDRWGVKIILRDRKRRIPGNGPLLQDRTACAHCHAAHADRGCVRDMFVYNNTERTVFMRVRSHCGVRLIG